MKVKMVICPACGKEIAANAKTCPSCGAKIKKPFYKKWWFIVLVIIILLGIVAGSSSSEPSSDGSGTSGEEQQIEYIVCTVDDMEDLLDENPLSAEDTYAGQYVEMTGKLNVIDSDGNYIGVYSLYDDFDLLGVHCSIKSDEQLEAVKGMAVGDKITVRGKITEVGEVFGYSMNIEEIL